MNKIGLFFGSFNPIHHGHMLLSNYILSYTDINEIWFIISPQNPFKDKKILIDEKYRLDMVNIAIKDDHRLKASNIEFNMPQPSYTIDTITKLIKMFPEYDFSIIMGADGLINFNKWKESEWLINNIKRYVYPRPEIPHTEAIKHKNITYIRYAPLIEISSTFIRESIKNNKDIRHFLPSGVYEYILTENLYKI